MKTPGDLYTLSPGNGPLVLSVPHAGTLLPHAIARRLTPQARGLPDTDWYVDDLYDFAGDIGATMIVANYSRYVIDLNRPSDNQSLYPGQATTGLCPPITFDGTPIYSDGGSVAPDEVALRRAAYWQPYHDRVAAEIARVKAAHGFALLYDCHSIASRVPRLFEGLLPVLNLGTANTTSCHPDIERRLASIMADSGFTAIVNGRFVGGHITRAFGRPDEGVHAVQMELGCQAYLAAGNGYRCDVEKVARLKPVLRRICETFTAWRP
jgi:N-formylglutamate amidohydrolase